LSHIVNFLKSLEFWRNIMHQMMQLKMHVSEQSYMSARKWSLVVNSHLRVAFGHPFLAVGGLKDAPRIPAWEHVTPFITAGHLLVARGGHFCSPPGALRAHTSNRPHVTQEKLYWRWKIAERCQLRRRTATARLLCDTFFLTARHRHSEILTKKGKTCRCLERRPCGVKKELLQYCGSSGAVRPPTEITKKHAVSAS
jgi:hypothetical protein